jgi:hypothetical protein
VIKFSIEISKKCLMPFQKLRCVRYNCHINSAANYFQQHDAVMISRKIQITLLKYQNVQVKTYRQIIIRRNYYVWWYTGFTNIILVFFDLYSLRVVLLKYKTISYVYPVELQVAKPARHLVMQMQIFLCL